MSIIEGDEDGRVVNFSVQLGTPLPHDVKFQYATANGSATAGSDYAATSGIATNTDSAVDVKTSTAGTETSSITDVCRSL